MSSYAGVTAALRGVLRPESSPIAVRFLEGTELDGGARPARRRFCQALMEARAGQRVLLTAENPMCPASTAALGSKPLPERLASGQMLVGFGIFATAEAGRKTIEAMPRLAPGRYAAVARALLEAADPDVVEVEDLPERQMWLALAARQKLAFRRLEASGDCARKDGISR